MDYFVTLAFAALAGAFGCAAWNQHKINKIFDRAIAQGKPHWVYLGGKWNPVNDAAKNLTMSKS